MLIDISANIGHWPFHQLHYNTCKGMQGRMDQFGVDKAIISNLNGIFYKNTQSANEELISEIEAQKIFKTRFIPFAILNPIYAGWKDDYNTCIHKMKMRGIRLYPGYHDYGISDTACMELLELAAKDKVPVAFTIRIVDSRERSWLDIDYVAGTSKPEWNLKNYLPALRQVPQGKYMFLNLANKATFSDEEKRVFDKASFLIDTSGRSITDMGEAIQNFGIQKIAFGTHAPLLDYATSLLRIESLKSNETNSTGIDAIRYKNVLSMLES